MKIVSNNKKIKLFTRIGQITGLTGMVLLVIGLYISFTQSETNAGLWLILFVLGFGLSQIGIYFGNRYLKEPTPVSSLNTALKGFGRDFTLYHYYSSAPHLLVGPAGIWALFPRYQRGTIVYEKNRWKQKGGGIWLGYLKIFAQEGLGRPDLEIDSAIRNLTSDLAKSLPEGMEVPPIHPVLLFSHPDIKLDVANAPISTLPINKIKEHIRKFQKQYRLSPEIIDAVNAAILPVDLKDTPDDSEE